MSKEKNNTITSKKENLKKFNNPFFQFYGFLSYTLNNNMKKLSFIAICC